MEHDDRTRVLNDGPHFDFSISKDRYKSILAVERVLTSKSYQGYYSGHSQSWTGHNAYGRPVTTWQVIQRRTGHVALSSMRSTGFLKWRMYICERKYHSTSQSKRKKGSDSLVSRSLPKSHHQWGFLTFSDAVNCGTKSKQIRWPNQILICMTIRYKGLYERENTRIYST